MKFKEAIADTNRALMEFVKHDHWELRESYRFYKQSIQDFCYATKFLARWLLALCAFPLIPVLYPIAVIIRMVKK